MKLIFLLAFVQLMNVAFAEDILKPGIYHNISSNDQTICSWNISSDRNTKTMDLIPVNQYDGNYDCIKNFSMKLTCDDQLSNGTTSCYMYPGSTRAIVKNSTSISIQDIIPKYNLGNLIWVAEKSLAPKKFLRKAGVFWKYSTIGGEAKCKIPPYDAVLDCSKLPVELLQSTCQGLEDTAKEIAMKSCEFSTAGACKIIFSNSQIIQQRSSENSVFNKESGCEWTAIATRDESLN